MKLRIIADIHLEGPHQLEGWSYERVMDEYTSDTYIVGDLFSIDSCKKKRLDLVLDQQKMVIAKYKQNYIAGNHDRFDANFVGNSEYYLIKNNILLTHLDWKVFWTDEKVLDWKKKSKGMGKFKRTLYSAYKGILSPNYDKSYEPSQEIVDNVDKLLSFIQLKTGAKCDTVIGGHRHKRCDVITDRGNRFITCTRGLTEVEL